MLQPKFVQRDFSDQTAFSCHAGGDVACSSEPRAPLVSTAARVNLINAELRAWCFFFLRSPRAHSHRRLCDDQKLSSQFSARAFESAFFESFIFEAASRELFCLAPKSPSPPKLATALVCLRAPLRLKVDSTRFNASSGRRSPIISQLTDCKSPFFSQQTFSPSNAACFQLQNKKLVSRARCSPDSRCRST